MVFSGEKLKKIRQERGLTRAELAKRAPDEMTRQSVRNWEEGLMIPRVKSIQALCRVLGVDFGLFFATDDYHGNNEASDAKF